MGTSTASPISHSSSIELAGAVVDKQNHGLVALDPAGAILLWNDWMQAWTGIESSQALGKIFLNLFPGLHGSDYARAITKVNTSGQGLTWYLDREPELIDTIEAVLAFGYRELPLSRIAVSPFALSSQSGCLCEYVLKPKAILCWVVAGVNLREGARLHAGYSELTVSCWVTNVF